MLENRIENFKLINNSEVCELLIDKMEGRVTGVRILGKREADIRCDAVVMCTGAWSARSLS